MQTSLLIWIPLLPLMGFLINGALAMQQARGKIGQKHVFSSVVACATPFLSFFLSLWAFYLLAFTPGVDALSTGPLLKWMVLQNFSLHFGLQVDPLTSVMILIVTGVGSLIHLYSTGYMKGDEAYARYLSYINLFLFFMLVLVMADSLPFLFVGWEGVGLCSYLLIGFWFTDKEKAIAGNKAFIVNRIGDCGFLIGMFVLAAVFTGLALPEESGTNFLSFEFLTKHVFLLEGALVWTIPAVTVACLCLLIGATGKSAQIPLYVWLPDAMAGPTPVSALIHAATMVTAGVYMVARMQFLFSLSPVAMTVTATIGLATALVAALIAITQYDIKKVLAYSTVSQLGYMFLALGVGASAAAIFHVMTHAFFKACLFLGAGSVIHALHHEQDIRNMGGLMKKMPITAWTFLIATLAIAGFPGLSGFFSKDEILYMTFANGAHPIFYWGALFTAGLTAFYMMRLFIYTFLGETRHKHPEKIHESPWVMTFPLLKLASLAALGGLIGLPHLFGHNYIGEWLASLGQNTPHHLPGPLQEGHLMLLSTFWGLLWMGMALAIYLKAPQITQTLKQKLAWLYGFMSAKFKVDEFYDFCVVRPLRFLSDRFLFKIFDVKFVDGFLVHGFVDASWFLMRSFSALHTGLIGQYMLYLLLGLLFVFGFVVMF